MKKFVILAALLVLGLGSLTTQVFAGPPFVNLEGVGGVAFNPLAYLADSGEEFIKIGDINILAKPRFGAWYVSLPDAKIDWEAAPSAFHKNNIGAKLLLLEENSFETKSVPAISIGAI
jgi:hypothetical protein